jgi:hypothetical protein
MMEDKTKRYHTAPDMKLKIRTILNNVIVTSIESDHMQPAYTYHQKFIWSKREKNETIDRQEDDNHNDILDDAQDFVIEHREGTSEGN